VCLSLSEGGKTQVRTVDPPATTKNYRLDGFNIDGSLLFATTPAPEGGIWSISMPDCKFRLLYTQPPPRWPPPYDKEGPPPYGKPHFGGYPLPSPSGRLLAFHSYPPDNYFAEVVWVINLSTGETRQLTWEDSYKYSHVPLEWRNDRQLVFFRLASKGLVGDFLLILPEDLWGEQRQGKGQRPPQESE